MNELKSPPVGLEPTIFGLEVQRVIHYATRAIIYTNDGTPNRTPEKSIVQTVYASTTKKTTPRGFEPLRAEPNGFLVHLLNHSDTVSLKISRPRKCERNTRRCADEFNQSKPRANQALKLAPTHILPARDHQKRQRGDLNPCGQSPSDFESDSLTTRTHCRIEDLAIQERHQRL